MCERWLAWVITAAIVPFTLAACSRSGAMGAPDAAPMADGSVTECAPANQCPLVSCACAASTCAPATQTVTTSGCHDGQCLGAADLCPSACAAIASSWQPTPPPPGTSLRSDAWASVSVPAAFDAAVDVHGTAADDFRVVVGTNYGSATPSAVRTMLWHVSAGVITDETPQFLTQFTGDVAHEQALRVWVFGSGKRWLITSQTQRSTSDIVSKLYELDGATTTTMSGGALDAAQTLNAIAAVSDSDVYLGGTAAGGMPLLLHYDGAAFATITLPDATFAEWVQDIGALSSSEVYVLTSTGRLLKGAGSQFAQVTTGQTGTPQLSNLVTALGSVYLIDGDGLDNSVVRWTGSALTPECVPTSDGFVDYLTAFPAGPVIAVRKDEVWVKGDNGWQSLPNVAAADPFVWGSGAQTTYAFVPDSHVQGKGAVYRLP